MLITAWIYLNQNLNLIEGWGKPKRFSITRYSIESSRGCPFNCEFCCVPNMFPPPVRYRENEGVVEEIEKQIRNGQPHFFFTDDNFLLRPERTQNLLELMARKGIECRSWNAQIGVESIIRANQQTPEIFRLMKLTGAERQFIGFESINPETLQHYKKPQSLEKIREALAILKRWKIRIHGMFVFGGDSDTKATFGKTLEFCIKSKLNSMWASVLTAFPGTPLRKRLEREGRLLTTPEEFPEKWMDCDGLHAEFAPRNISPRQLETLTLELMRRYYSLSEVVRSFFSHSGFFIKLWGWRIVPKLKGKP